MSAEPRINPFTVLEILVLSADLAGALFTAASPVFIASGLCFGLLWLGQQLLPETDPDREWDARLALEFRIYICGVVLCMLGGGAAYVLS